MINKFIILFLMIAYSTYGCEECIKDYENNAKLTFLIESSEEEQSSWLAGYARGLQTAIEIYGFRHSSDMENCN
jgi:hypothetical protein